VIDAIRGTGAGQLILVPNSRGSDVEHWDTYAPNGGPLDSEAALAITDSAGNCAFDMHAYQNPGAPTSYAAQVTPVTEWAEKHGKRLFLSEPGVQTDDPHGAAAINSLLTYLNDHSGVWLGWTPWNLSPYNLTVTGEDGAITDGPQLPWYAPFLTPDTVQGPSPDRVRHVLTGVGQILGGVAQDGGGWIVVGGVLHKVPRGPRS
jgi:endoglucanase